MSSLCIGFDRDAPTNHCLQCAIVGSPFCIDHKAQVKHDHQQYKKICATYERQTTASPDPDYQTMLTFKLFASRCASARHTFRVKHVHPDHHDEAHDLCVAYYQQAEQFWLHCMEQYCSQLPSTAVQIIGSPRYNEDLRDRRNELDVQRQRCTDARAQRHNLRALAERARRVQQEEEDAKALVVIRQGAEDCLVTWIDSYFHALDTLDNLCPSIPQDITDMSIQVFRLVCRSLAFCEVRERLHKRCRCAMCTRAGWHIANYWAFCFMAVVRPEQFRSDECMTRILRECLGHIMLTCHHKPFHALKASRFQDYPNSFDLHNRYVLSNPVCDEGSETVHGANSVVAHLANTFNLLINRMGLIWVREQLKYVASRTQVESCSRPKQTSLRKQFDSAVNGTKHLT